MKESMINLARVTQHWMRINIKKPSQGYDVHGRNVKEKLEFSYHGLWQIPLSVRISIALFPYQTPEFLV